MSASRTWPPGSVILTVLFLVLVGTAAGTRLFRKPDAPPRANPAVQRVLDAYSRLSAKYLRATPDTSPSQYAWAMGRMCDELERQDLATCPSDFRVAVTHNVSALRDARAVLQRYPDNFLEGVAMGAMNFLVRGEADGGLNRLQNDVQEALRRIRATSEEIDRIAAKYTD